MIRAGPRLLVIPDTTASLVGNLTVTRAATGGFFGIGARIDARPRRETLPFRAARTKALLVLPRRAADETGTVLLENVSSGPAHAILDVTGRFR